MKVAVVGIGYVGLVAAACLADGGNHVICIDKDQKKIENLLNGIIPIYEPGLTEVVKKNVEAGRLIFTTDLKEGIDNSLVVFLAVGTPSASDGSADISAVLAVARQVAQTMSGYRIIVTKSTVPVGTHRKVSDVMLNNTSHPFDYVSNPEFLKEGTAVDDFMMPDRVIIGTTNPAVMEIMKQLYSPFMRKNARMLFMDPASAEMTKYAANAMLATRISFMNEVSQLCDKFGADVEMVRQGVGSDKRIGNSFLFPSVGYGGSCFPKDVKALVYMGNEMGMDMSIARTVEEVNYRQQDLFAQRIMDYFAGKSDQVTLAVWGLAFKAKTDDVRESPALRCIRKLLENGIKVRAYDPEAASNAFAELEGRIELAQDSYAMLKGADALVIFTEWQEFRNPDFEEIGKKLNKPVIFDGRNLYEPSYIKKQGIEYHCIGRPTT
ncbi:MAG: UDP-glucose/GDP-mannose dehydrogenase family protein [Sedimentisphaerales bacterium]|nr:UDP-glucose/GDP-mannose dehydrogenase family protein [Sedimentisphaerales bacterium]